MIAPERVRTLNEKDMRPGRYVLYWMQQAQRAEANHALEWAIGAANERGAPLLAVFGVTSRFPEANLRHYTFMLEGLRETKAALGRRGVQLVVRAQAPVDAVLELAREAALVVVDRGYPRVQRAWRARVAERAPCRVVEVESDVIVPVAAASPKEEYAARTLRPKIHRLLEDFLHPVETIPVKKDSLAARVDGESLEDVAALLKRLRIRRDVPPSIPFRGGAAAAHRLLDEFIAAKLARYADEGNDPTLHLTSRLSPYLHFGQISPLTVALAVQDATETPRKSRDAFLEQLIVRRELSMNFVCYNPRYDSYDCLPDWARRTLAKHARDRREYVYSRDEFEGAATHDPYWNAAQREMVLTGHMPNYLRMYWGKKIIEWTRTPEEAFAIALHLNNRYELDGRDPNGCAGVAWCFGKHDRPWAERPVFGTVRYLGARGLERKFDMAAYVRGVAALARA